MRRITAIIAIMLFLFTVSVEAQDYKMDIKLRDQGFELVKKTKGVYEDSAMTAYINKVGQKLVAQLDTVRFEYKFFIVNQAAPNAFALPGGYIFITTGIIPIIENEDELACIIGHEIIHSNNRHTVRQLKKRVLPLLLTLPFDIIGATVPGAGTAVAPISTSRQLLFASYSRKNETEADDQGVILAAKAGYDPLALPKVLNRMNKVIKLVYNYTEEKNYFADHPYTPDRVKNINEQVKGLKVVKSQVVSDKFLYEFKGLTYGKSPNQGIIRDHAFLHPDLDFYIEYPDDWTINNMDTAVVANSSYKDAAVALSIEKPGKTAEQTGKEYVNGLSKKYKKILKKADVFKVNDTEGYLVSFQEVVFQDTTFAYVLYLKVGDNLFKFTAMSNENHRATLLKIAQSLRVLTAEEKQSIFENYLNVVEANEGEKMDELSKRFDSVIKVDVIRALNDHEKGDKLKAGEPIKIISKRVYKSK